MSSKESQIIAAHRRNLKVFDLGEDFIVDFLQLRASCRDELSEMKHLIGKLQPRGPYIVYASAVVLSSVTFCHGEGQRTLTDALVRMHPQYDHGWFATDAENKIVAADADHPIPVVKKYNSFEIRSTEVMTLTDGDVPVDLYYAAHCLLQKCKAKIPTSVEIIQMLLSEGVGEKFKVHR